MKPTKKVWLAIIGAAPLIVAAPGLANAGAAPSATHHSYVHSSVSLRHTAPLAHPAHPFRTHPVDLSTKLQHGTKFSTVASNNWSGFATFGDHFRFVGATYTVPSLNCFVSPNGSAVGQWVGLDGYNSSSTVEQVGTNAFCSGTTPNYFMFYEMFPNNAVEFSGVSPGDSVTVSVFFTGTQWQLALFDNTSGNSLTTVQSCPSGSTCRNRSAELISEVPNGGPPNATLPDYGIIGFTHIAITDIAGHHFNVLSPDWKNDKISEVNLSVPNGDVMQTPSKLEGSVGGTGGGPGNQAFTIEANAPE